MPSPGLGLGVVVLAASSALDDDDAAAAPRCATARPARWGGSLELPSLSASLALAGLEASSSSSSASFSLSLVLALVTWATGCMRTGAGASKSSSSSPMSSVGRWLDAVRTEDELAGGDSRRSAFLAGVSRLALVPGPGVGGGESRRARLTSAWLGAELRRCGRSRRQRSAPIGRVSSAPCAHALRPRRVPTPCAHALRPRPAPTPCAHALHARRTMVGARPVLGL